MGRRSTGLAAALAALALALPAGAGAAATNFQADAAHSGNAGKAGLRAPLRQRWTRRIGGRPSYPVIAGGRVFVTVTRPGLRGASVLALSPRSGRVLWRRDLGPEPAGAALAYDRGRLFVARQNYYLEGPGLLALDPRDGRVLWTSGVSLFEANPPVATGGVVYLNAEGVSVLAFRESDGARIWNALSDSGAGGAPAIAGDGVFAVMSNCPDVHRFDRATGAQVWHRENGCHGGGGSVASVHRGRVYALEGDHPVGGDVYDAATGAHVRRLISSEPPAFAGRVGVFSDAWPGREAFAAGATLVARDVRTDRVRWRFRGDGSIEAPPLIAGGIVYAGSGSGRVYGVSLRSGRRVWRTRPGPPIPGARGEPVPNGLAAGGGLLVVPALGRVVAYG
jgi:outer membrane protein assembly factor BamB